MDSQSTPIALLSIKPRFADAILAGRKKVEFRKVRFTKAPKYIVLYVSTPIRQVIAFCEVVEVQEHTVLGLWRKHRGRGGIEYDEFLAYYNGRKRGYGIIVGAVWKLHRPASLQDLGARSTPPQNFQYMSDTSISRLRRRRVSLL